MTDLSRALAIIHRRFADDKKSIENLRHVLEVKESDPLYQVFADLIEHCDKAMFLVESCPSP